MSPNINQRHPILLYLVPKWENTPRELKREGSTKFEGEEEGEGSLEANVQEEEKKQASKTRLPPILHSFFVYLKSSKYPK